jgi:flagella basal body P-ring formation protein FlgA
MKPFNARLSGHVQEMIDLQVTTRRMNAGEVISPDDIQPARVRAGLARSEPARAPDQAVGMALQRPLNAGSPVMLSDLGRPMMVLRGSSVQVQLNRPGLAVTLQGVALEAAALGDPVHVLNPNSRAVMAGQVTGTAAVRVDGASNPVLLSPGAPIPPPPPARLAGR